jgi:hypothetical protein
VFILLIAHDNGSGSRQENNLQIPDYTGQVL